MAKLFSLSLLARLDPLSEERGWRAREQAGFRPRYRTEDHQLLVTYMCQAAAAGRGPMALAFIDLLQAYDRVSRA